eukprot:10542577-Alexandrium_andersonii.AAC.1
MLAQYLKTNASMSMVFTIQDITRFKWLGDNKLNEFYLGWVKLVNNVQANEEVSPTFLRDPPGTQPSWDSWRVRKSFIWPFTCSSIWPTATRRS